MSELRATDGAFVCKWGKSGGAGGEVGRGSQEGEFDGPEAVAMSGQGEVYVCDSGNHRIQVFV